MDVQARRVRPYAPGVEALTMSTSARFLYWRFWLCSILMGLYPLPLMEVMHTTVDDLLAHVARSKL
jgi:NADH-quinone oxidoreductase subunit M